MADPTGPEYVYRAALNHVIDGDTYVLQLDLGFSCSYAPHVRLYGVDCPELRTPEGKAAKAYVTDLVTPFMPLLVRSHKDQRSFERWVAEVWFLKDGWQNLADNLVQSGHATRKFQ